MCDVSFIHHPDNRIVINGCNFSLDEFRLVVPKYRLPENASHRVYIRNKKHYIVYGKSRKHLPLVDNECESYIQKLDDLLYLFRHYDEDIISMLICEQKRNIHTLIS